MNFFTLNQPNKFIVNPPEYHFSDPLVRRLVEAVMTDNLSAAKQAIASGADPNAEGVMRQESHSGFSPLHYALAAENAKAVKMLYSLGADPERKAHQMGTPLLFSIMLNNEKALRLLLDLKPVNQLSTKTQQQLLFESVRRNAPDCFKLLIERNVPIDIKDDAGYTLMLRSIEMSEPEVTLWLLDHGASVNIVTLSGVTPAYSIEWELKKRTQKGSPKEAMVNQIIQRMKELGAEFPGVNPEEVLARQKKQGSNP